MNEFAPDAIGVELGWRAWRLEERGGQMLLASVTRPQVWPARQALEAACEQTAHTPPVSSCSCGIYSARSPELLQEMAYPDFGDEETIVVGEVALWGTIIAATHGWRAQFAYPSQILVPYERWQHVASLRAAYGVHVSLANTLRERR